jgi:hypothetical protein
MGMQRWQSKRAFPVVRTDALVGLVCLDGVRKVPRQE